MNKNQKIRRKNLTLQERADILEMYKNPEISMETIMERYNVSKPTISQIASNNGLSRKRKWTDEEISLILRMEEIGIEELCIKLSDTRENIKAIYYHYRKKTI